MVGDTCMLGQASIGTMHVDDMLMSVQIFRSTRWITSTWAACTAELIPRKSAVLSMKLSSSDIIIH